MKVLKKVLARPKYQIELPYLEAKALQVALLEVELRVTHMAPPKLATVLAQEGTILKLWTEITYMLNERPGDAVQDIELDPNG